MKKIMMPNPLNVTTMIETGVVYPETEVSNLYRRFMDVGERFLIKSILQQVHGNQVSASRLLGIDRNTLRKKLKKLHLTGIGLDRRAFFGENRP